MYVTPYLYGLITYMAIYVIHLTQSRETFYGQHGQHTIHIMPYLYKLIAYMAIYAIHLTPSRGTFYEQHGQHHIYYITAL